MVDNENNTDKQALLENERKFAEEFPYLYAKYQAYKRYYTKKTRKDIYEDDYNSIIIKSLIAYFLYKEKYNMKAKRKKIKNAKVRSRKKITLADIALLLNYKSHTGAIYAIQSINKLLKFSPEYKVIDKGIKDIWFNFSFIMTHYNPKKTDN